MINITKLEAEYILECLFEIKTLLDEQLVDQHLDGVLDYIATSKEILQSCLTNSESTAYVLEKDNEEFREYLHALDKEYPDIENDTDI